jgi:hypothetical protein
MVSFMKIASPFEYLHRSLCEHARHMEQQSSIVKFGLVTILLLAVFSQGAHRRFSTYRDCSSAPCTKTFIESLFRGI